jgi:hypothetical protein
VSASYWSTLVATVFSRRDAHRPQDRATLRYSAAELRARGLTPTDIAAAPRLSERAVRDLLEVPYV